MLVIAKLTTPAMEKFNRKHKDIAAGMRQYSFTRDAWRRLSRNRTAVLGMCIIILLALTAVFADFITPYGQFAVNIKHANQPPNALHWFGTDTMGRDIFTRCIYGARYSLSIGIACMLCALAVGGTLGLVSAYFGRTVDTAIMRITDILSSIPAVLMAIIMIAALGNGIPQLIIAMTISFLPGMTRTVRAAIFTTRQSDYIESCRCIGASNIRVMFRHMMPNALGLITISAVGQISGCIMVISTLSYIGLGITPPTPEWGALLAAGKNSILIYPHMVLFPGLMIMVTVLGFNTFGDGLRDALDPRLK